MGLSDKHHKRIILKKIKTIKRLFYSEINNLIPWIIKDTPNKTAAQNGFTIELNARMNAIIPIIKINNEDIFDIFESEIRPAIPNKIITIPTR